MGAVIPSLSVDGFITNNDEIMLRLFEHFKASDKSQSNFYNGVASLKYIINQYNEADDIKRIISSTLTTMYSKYFASVDVSTNAVITDGAITINLDIKTVSNTGSKHMLSLSMAGMVNNIKTFEIQQDKIRG